MDIEDFLGEAKAMKILQHNNLVQLLGVSFRETMFYVMEFIDCGNLLDYLRDPEKSKDIDVTLLMHFSAQIASAMMYLEEIGYVYR